MPLATRLALGTVQFGLDYGVTNSAERPGFDEVRHILARARAAGIDLLDTAYAYGDSETLLGQIPDLCSAFGIVTKTPPALEPSAIEAAFTQSLSRLGCSPLYGLLVHSGRDLAGPGGVQVLDALQRLKERGLVARIGASVYEASELDAILERFVPDLVQLPLSVLDQRLAVSGHLDRLKALGTEIHVRSVFLQGVLVTPPENAPAFLGPYRGHLETVARRFRELGLSPLAGCLAFPLQHPAVDRVVVGVCSRREIEQVIEAANDVPEAAADVSDLASNDARFVDPRTWPQGRT